MDVQTEARPLPGKQEKRASRSFDSQDNQHRQLYALRYTPAKDLLYKRYPSSSGFILPRSQTVSFPKLCLPRCLVPKLCLGTHVLETLFRGPST
jgi:hypothetical protein